MITVDAAARRAAKRLRFVETDGAPVLLLPRERAHLWHGLAGAPWVGKHKEPARLWSVWGLILPGNTPTTFLETPDGGIVLRIERGEPAAAVAAALSLDAQAWQAMRGELSIASWEKVVLLDARRKGKAYHSMHKLAVGRYKFDQARFTARVEDGGEEEVTLWLLRLRKKKSRAI